MKKGIRLFLVVFGIMVLLLPSLSPAGDEEGYLAPEDFEAIGLSGVKAVSRDPMKGFGGDLNFAAENGAALLMVQIVGSENFPSFREMGSAEIEGLGDDAVKGATMPGLPTNFICFVTGDRCVALITYVNNDMPDRNILSEDQLLALARILESRI